METSFRFWIASFCLVVFLAAFWAGSDGSVGSVGLSIFSSFSGLPLIIDDFGTGYSNFHTLQELNITAVKIDRSIIQKISRSTHDFHIAKAIISMSKSLDFGNIAEGVEDIETLHLLQQLECDVAQGYFWCEPQNQQDFSQWLYQH